MSIIVTGAAGFIGSQFVENLLRNATSLGSQKAGHPEKITVLDKLTYAGSLATLDHAVQQAGGDQARARLEFVKGDIADRSLVYELVKRVKPKAIVNFAAESHVDRSIESAAEFIETNIMGVFSLLDAARRYHESLSSSPQASAFRFVQVSTDEVFGQLGEEGAFSEETPYAPSSPYSASKASGDHLVRAWYHTYKLPVIVTNCSNNYGPRQYPEKLIPHMIHCALKNKPLPVYGNGGNVRDWIHVDDHARGVELAMRKGTVGQSYCFGGRSERRNLDVVKAICAILDELRPRTSGSYGEQITFVEDRKGHDWRYAIDDTKSETTLGFKRRYDSFEMGLRATVQWYLENQEWVEAVTKEKK
ncbi:MAG: dTDP-glucose 4,6-dehydratase [Deltaproteobacteria bacterium]|nr:dTDP-glucose 4,6-dehydratase [Deltaproteobacteria bacterium]